MLKEPGGVFGRETVRTCPSMLLLRRVYGGRAGGFSDLGDGLLEHLVIRIFPAG